MLAKYVCELSEGILLRNCGGSLSHFRNGYEGIRFLFSPAAIGLDNYSRMRDRTKTQFVNLTDKFKSKMLEFSDPSSTNMIFTEDLKNMIHLAEDSGDDLDLVYKMMTRFNQQNKEVRFGSYVFGPVIMRMYYFLNKPDEALKVFKDPALEGFFAQLSTYQILMDLLFENERYQDILDVFEIIKGRQHQEAKYPKNVVILTFAACFKLNTEESFKFGLDLWKELKEVGHIPMRRAVTFAAGMALNQNAPHIAFEMISDVQQHNYVTIRNLKAAALADIGRPEDALPILRSILDADVPSQRKQTFSEDVIQKLKDAINKNGSKDAVYEFNQVEKRLSEGGHITKETLNEQLCVQIAETVRNQSQDRNQRFLAASFGRQDLGRARTYARPGLKDLY
ncbi:pentatricopeptide repeat-containing protein 2, mitochondrial-like [Zootermopsis nevadensis]|uniref:Pentatricopeptide repeat-containing protein 2 n=1 Tax=Zootermopsis nevadensis TaxID=136037 RepID=A0A067QGI5_ZOONE|nr:pentatricopeptide repeat-containing protein 2, mitochondrial-like [Zootermopsis nevadensis]KDR07029.1 Pentatricopeptide repeat-containing protein 2 [Zootermopsis nevadensis]